MNLILSGMRDRRKFLLESESGNWSKTSEVLTDGGVLGFSGFADIRQVGLIHRSSLFVAIYLFDGHLWIRVGEVVRNIETSSMRRFSVAPFVKAFTMEEQGQSLFTYRYWWSDVHEWPDDDILDIFLYIVSEFGGSRARRRAVALWSLMQQGISATEASRELEKSGFDGDDMA